ncbi:MAG TPA: thioesterase domain-containing protein [Micromonosporaceae bacterium]
MTGRTAWLPRPPSPTAAGRVFCIPYAGCGAGLFRNWPREQDSIEFLPVELPGRETRLAEPVPKTFQDMASAMIEALLPYMDVPFAFFGHCWSALPAYEATAQLHREGMPMPVRLFVSSQVAPQDGPVGRMLGMNDAEMAEELETTIRALGGQPHPALIEIYVSVLRADVDVSRQYIVPDPLRLSCPITAIGWTDDAEVGFGQMTGWADVGDTTFELFNGRHHRFIDAPPELLKTLSSGMRS